MRRAKREKEVCRHFNGEGRHFPGRRIIKARYLLSEACNNIDHSRAEMRKFGPSEREIARRSGVRETEAREFTLGAALRARVPRAASHARYVFRIPEYTPVC